MASVTYSFNTQREERVNQGGNGNPTATIGHEPERTTANGVQGSVFKQFSPRMNLRAGGEIYFEALTSDSFNVNPVSGAVSVRRPRVPSDATYRNYGIYAATNYVAVPDRLQLVGAVRWGGAHYESHASDAPMVSGKPLWPDDSSTTSSPSFRIGAVATPDDTWSFSASFSRGYRSPHIPIPRSPTAMPSSDRPPAPTRCPRASRSKRCGRSRASHGTPRSGIAIGGHGRSCRCSSTTFTTTSRRWR
jgi:hemoglobin/transferrin/lactoferrin receptor protein